MNTCCSFTPMQRQLAITSSSFPLSHVLNARSQRRNGCQPMHVKLTTNVPAVALCCGRGQGTAACVFVHTVLFRVRRFRPHDVDTAESISRRGLGYATCRCLG